MSLIASAPRCARAHWPHYWPSANGWPRRVAALNELSTVPPDLRASARRQSHAKIGAALPHAVRAADRRDAVGAGDRQERQSGDARVISSRPDTARDAETRARRPEAAYPHDRPVQRQGAQHHRDLPPALLDAAMAGSCTARARKRSKVCPESGAKPQTWCSMLLLASTPWRSTPTSTGSPIVPAWHAGTTPRAVEDGLLRVIPAEFLPYAHHWLILHGRYICKARIPDCPGTARLRLGAEIRGQDRRRESSLPARAARVRRCAPAIAKPWRKWRERRPLQLAGGADCRCRSRTSAIP